MRRPKKEDNKDTIWDKIYKWLSTPIGSGSSSSSDIWRKHMNDLQIQQNNLLTEHLNNQLFQQHLDAHMSTVHYNNMYWSLF